MKKYPSLFILGWAILATALFAFATSAFGQQPCTFKDEKIVIDTLSARQEFKIATSKSLTISTLWLEQNDQHIEWIHATYLASQYISQHDSIATVNWLLLCPENEPCEVYQRTLADGSMIYRGLKFRPGQEVHLKAQPIQTVKIASFNDFKSGAAHYPVLLFEQPYYMVYYLGYWSYLPESSLQE